MNGAARLLACLREEGVDTVFGYPGGAALPLYDALVDAPDLRHVLVRHEQGAAHAADAYARASGRVGVCLATSGPGATNLVTGLAAAFMDSVPLVAVTAQVASHLLGTDAFQEVDVVGITLPVTKHSILVRRAEDVPAVVHRAFALAREGRPGPVLVDLPKDVALAPVPDGSCRHVPASEGLPAPLSGDLEAARRLLAGARRPVLYAGGGVVHAEAWKALRHLARRCHIPVTTTLMALGTYPTDDPLFLGMPGMHGTRRANLALRDADLLIAVGARFDDRVTGRAAGFSPHSVRIHLDVDPAEAGKICRADLRLVGDARTGLEALAEVARAPDSEAWLRALGEHPRVPPLQGVPPGSLVNPAHVFEVMNRLLTDDTVVVTDVGQHQMWAAQCLRRRLPRTFLTSGGLGAMGFGVPGALGAALACAERPVVAVVGDGGFQMTAQELSTMKRCGVAAVVMILDNRCLGMVRQWQELFHGERLSQVDLSDNPDFVKLAESMGVPGLRVSDDAGLEPALAMALGTGGPFLLHVEVHARANVFPIVPPGEPAHVMWERRRASCPS